MFDFIGTFLWILITGVASIGGYITMRRFVRGRLRYVDALQRPFVPAVAGVLALGLALPVVGVLPVVGLSSAILFGVGVGSGVATGRRDTKRLPGP